MATRSAKASSRVAGKTSSGVAGRRRTANAASMSGGGGSWVVEPRRRSGTGRGRRDRDHRKTPPPAHCANLLRGGEAQHSVRLLLDDAAVVEQQVHVTEHLAEREVCLRHRHVAPQLLGEF